MPNKRALKTLILGGILPVVLFTVIEDQFGIVWGLVAGMATALIEVVYEWRTQGKVDNITWFGSGAMLVLGGVSLLTKEGFWFRMQPALLEAIMAGALIGSVLLGNPLMVAMARKQGTLDQIPPQALPIFEARMRGLTFRVGLFFLVHAAIATWAAYAWSVKAWAFLKGVGFTVSFLVYLALEVWIMRRRIPRPAAAAAPAKNDR